MAAFEPVSDLRFGEIVEVSGTTIRVELAGDVSELTRSYQGRVYSIGQIGSVVKVHFGRRLIFGFVTLLRMRSEEQPEGAEPIPPEADQRIMDVELFAEGGWNAAESELALTRGVSTYPLPRQGVYLLTREEAALLYSAAEGERSDQADHLVPFASYVGAEATRCRANIDRMFALHSAVLGSTGSGKSGAVTALLHSILDHKPSDGYSIDPRIVIIDPHGEYRQAFGDRAVVYRAYDTIGTEEQSGESIRLPYWLMSGEEFRHLVIGKTEQEATSQHNIVYKALTHARMVSAGLVAAAPAGPNAEAPQDGLEPDEPRLIAGADEDAFRSFDRDKPRPFSLEEFRNHIEFLQATRKKGDKLERVPPAEFAKQFSSILDKLAVLRRDPRIQFLMRDWGAGNDSALSEIIAQLVGSRSNKQGQNQDVRIIDISGLPNEVAGPLTASVARLLFQYKLHQTQAQKERDPVLLVCEEAHRYVPNQGEAQYAAAQDSIRRIAREGRKYGLGLMLVSQRPADVENTVISQCGTWLVLRLTNSTDQQHVARFLPDSLSGMTRALPSLGQQEALFVGEGASLPARIRIRDLEPSKLPKSSAIAFMAGWKSERLAAHELADVAGRMDGSSGPMVRRSSSGA